ncbi:Holliday junction branch migration DNA helicase RuvB [Aquiluna borgnonia]|uniref:Holliday junction branch migration complex subunit RuvB n=1 Tax=Aquiluna borgnonia TaxID=2499157 RepID=A0A7D4TRF8_9MICO|nr:Holliday junction branch migration DNA helicase RuvB [Aquiluna borgnonia]QKJ25253.1 Holliday junction branch migration DNA helicase RuvB [Aquiluna borgnonia]
MIEPTSDEREVEAKLRPTSLTEFVGQEKVVNQLNLILDAAKLHNRAPDHILLAGPPGLGKTTLAMIVAHDSGKPLRLTSGPAIQSSGDLASMLSALQSGDVLFIDEIHRMSRSAEEMLYLAMEDFRVDVMVGKGPGAASISLEIAPFTLVGATTRSGMLPTPLRDRFGFTAFLEYYEPADLVSVVTRASQKLGIEIESDAANALATRSRGTPRIANRLLRRVRDFAAVNRQPVITMDSVLSAMELFEVDALGLDRVDRQILTLLATQFSAKPVGLSTLAVAIGEEPDTIEAVIEPYLIRIGFIQRTPRGREITQHGIAHLTQAKR